jgi:hypothetical protein
MITKYNIKDSVWIHIGERTLTQGRVVEVIDLAHLEEGHDPEHELYVVELKSGIENVYEIRSFDQISPDADGPIGLFRKEDHRITNRAMTKVGMPLPQGVMEYEHDEPTPEQIHAAMERSQKAIQHDPIAKPKKSVPKKRFYKKKTV